MGFGRFLNGCLEPKVWIRGLLRKGLGLCHGIPGNGFALLKLHPTGGGNPKKIFASRISVVFLVGSRGSVAESCAAFRSLCSGVRHLNGDTQDKLNKPRLWMFGLQHYYAISRITHKSPKKTTSSVVLLPS